MVSRFVKILQVPGRVISFGRLAFFHHQLLRIFVTCGYAPVSMATDLTPTWIFNGQLAPPFTPGYHNWPLATGNHPAGLLPRCDSYKMGENPTLFLETKFVGVPIDTLVISVTLIRRLTQHDKKGIQ